MERSSSYRRSASSTAESFHGLRDAGRFIEEARTATSLSLAGYLGRKSQLDFRPSVWSYRGNKSAQALAS
jgi:hypothetical protein